MAESSPNPANNSPKHNDILEIGQAAAGMPVSLFDVPTLRAFEAPAGLMLLLEAAVDRANVESRRLEHLLLIGPDGGGKRVVARVLVRELAQRCVEVEGSCIDNLDHLMELLRQLRDRDVLVVHHIDRMPKRGQRHLAEALRERRAPRAARALREPWAKRDPDAPREKIADISLLATTRVHQQVSPDIGAIVELGLHLGPPSTNHLALALLRGLRSQGLGIATGALEWLAAKAHGQPGGAESLLRAVAISARAEGERQISQEFFDRNLAPIADQLVHRAAPGT